MPYELTPAAIARADRLAATFCKRHGVPVQEWAELRSAACLGLCRAARRFDPARGVPFQAFAFSHVRWAMLDHVEAFHRPDEEPHQDCTGPAWGTAFPTDVPLRADLRRAVGALEDPRERAAVLACLMCGEPVLAWGARRGLSRSQTSKLLAAAVGRLRYALAR